MTNRVLENFNKLAIDNQLEYLIIGGYAASYWGTPRFTADIDFAIERTQFPKVESIMASLSYVLDFKHPKGSFVHFSPSTGSDFRIDFVIVDSSTWKELYDKKSYADFGLEIKCPVVSPIHLIAMKLHSAKQPDRNEYLKDLADIIEVMLAQNITFQTLESDGILTKYGSESTNNELRRLLRARKAIP